MPSISLLYLHHQTYPESSSLNCRKGDGLEARIALPAWSPVLSLESVDGPLWQGMRTDLAKVMRLLPPPSSLLAITQRRVDKLLVDKKVVSSRKCRFVGTDGNLHSR